MGQDLLGRLRPAEGSAAIVPAVDKAADRRYEIGDAVVGPPADRLTGDDPKEDLDEVEPRSRGGRKVQHDPRVLRQPVFDVGMLVRAVVVDDDVQLATRVGTGDFLQKVQELLVAMPVVAAVGDLARGHLQSSKERRRAVADVVVGGFLRQPGAQREDRGGAVESLNLAVGSDQGAVSTFRLARFPGPPAEPDVPVSGHPALHKIVSPDYAAVPSVCLDHGEGMVLPR